MTRIPPGTRWRERRLADTTQIARFTKRHSRYGHGGVRGFLFSRAGGKATGLASYASGASRERSYAFPHLARCRHKSGKELLLLQRPAKRSNFAIVARRSAQDHLHQRPSRQAPGELFG